MVLDNHSYHKERQKCLFERTRTSYSAIQNHFQQKFGKKKKKKKKKGLKKITVPVKLSRNSIFFSIDIPWDFALSPAPKKPIKY
jgi:hypothetical protein